jgi:hypothetical protein
MRKSLMGALLLVGTACSAGKDANGDGIADGVYKPTDVSVIAPTVTVGTATGQVIDGSGAPLAGVTVKAAFPDQTNAQATTDASGFFAFKSVPGGTTVGLTLTKDGFTTGYGTVTVPSSSGNVPANNQNGFLGPVRLFATTGKVSFAVVGFDGSPVTPTAVLSVSPAWGLGDNLGGQTVVHGTVANGTVTFTGIPQLSELARLGSGLGQLSLAIDAFGADANGDPKYGGATLFVSAQEALESPLSLSVVLPDPAQATGDLKVVGSSCASLVHADAAPADSLVSAADKVYVAFNQKVRADSVAVTLIDDTGKATAATSETAATGNVIDFVAANGFTPGHAYTVRVQAEAAASVPAVQKTFSGTCFINSTGAGPVVSHAYYTPDSTGKLVTGTQVSVEFDSVVGSVAGSPLFSAFIDAELDGATGRLGTGEYDSSGRNTSPGFAVTLDPSKPSFSGFSRYFVFTYQGLALGQNKSVYLLFDNPTQPGSTRMEWLTGTPLPIAGTPVPSAGLLVAPPN